MKKEKQGQTLSVWVDEKILCDLDALAKKAGITRSKLVSNILDVATGELKTLEKVGVLRVTLLLRDLKDAFQRRFRKAEIVSEMLEIDE
jgi:hypothetical protein